MIIIALPDDKGGVSEATLVRHRTGRSTRQGKQLTLIDALPQGCALDRSEQGARSRFDHLFGAIRLVRDTLHREPPMLARHSDHTVTNNRPRGADSWIRSPDPTSSASIVAALCRTQLAVGITPALRGCVKIAACLHGVTVTDMLRDLLARERPDTNESQP